jgi:hypothetical protein
MAQPFVLPQIHMIEFPRHLLRDIAMSAATANRLPTTCVEVPAELTRLRDQIGALPPRFRDALRPMADEAVEQALFRGRVLSVAREGLERYRLDLAIAQFDLDATRREREALRCRLESLGGT